MMKYEAISVLGLMSALVILALVYGSSLGYFVPWLRFLPFLLIITSIGYWIIMAKRGKKAPVNPDRLIAENVKNTQPVGFVKWLRRLLVIGIIVAVIIILGFLSMGLLMIIFVPYA